MGARFLRSLAGLFFFITIVYPGLWDGPDEALSLARSPIRTGTRIFSQRPQRSLNADLTCYLTRFYITRETSSRNKQIYGFFPGILASMRVGSFEFSVSAQQTMRAEQVNFTSSDAMDDNLQDIRMYRLCGEGAWWIKDNIALIVAYNHYLSSFHVYSSEANNDHFIQGIGNGSGGSVGFLLSPGERYSFDLLAYSPASVNLKGVIPSTLHPLEAPTITGNLTTPLVLVGDLRILTFRHFETFLTISYELTTLTDSMYLEVPDEYSAVFSTVPLYDRNTFRLCAGAGFEPVPYLGVRFVGSYVTAPALSFSEKSWINPQYVSLAGQVRWQTGIWRFRGILGTERYHPFNTVEGSYVEGLSFFAGVGAGIEF